MKLRNKKTGEIVETDYELSISVPSGEKLYGSRTYDQIKGYSSIAELNEEWEDYAPKEPLIKDEKIRKAVRAWWDCCQEGLEDKRIYIKDAEFRMGIYRLDLGRYYFFDDKKEGFYSINQLCGDEE